MTAAVVALAGVRIARSHVVRSVGGRGRAVALVAGVVGVIIALAALAFGFYAGVLPTAFDPLPPSAPDSVRAAQRVLVATFPVSGAVIAALLLVVVPSGTELRLTAQLAGAARWQIALGEFAPMAAALAASCVVASAGSVLFAASRSPRPIAVAIGLFALALAVTFAAASVALIVGGVAHRLGWPDAAARLVGMCAALALLASLLVDLVANSLGGGTPALVTMTGWLWHGRVLPDDLLSAGSTALVAVAVIVAALGASALSGSTSPLVVPPRLVPGPRAGRLPRPLAAVLRETVLALRNTTGQLAAAVSLLLSTALVILGRLTPAPPEVVLAGLAIVCASGAELAYGRTMRWVWLLRSAGVPIHRRVLAQVAAMFVLGLPPFVVGACVLGGSPDVLIGRAATGTVTLAMLVAVGYLAGVVVPFDGVAATGMLITATVAIALDGIVLWLTAGVLVVGSVASLGVEMLVTVLAVAGATLLVRLRESTE